MIVTCVHVHVKEPFIKAFTEASAENHLASVEESGNCRFDILQLADDSSVFLLYEAYESEEDAARHKETPHYLKWRETVADWMAEPRKGVKYHALWPK
ncbi:MAG: antibiotic biosynthesis monooxygenase [Bacteroidales bacterium]|nr:antibiotic biosynthesis monooxygenase [Bacteroidales bacterium]